jgi:hypothetical protein
LQPLDQLLRKCEKAIYRVQSGESTIDEFEVWLVELLKAIEPCAVEFREACSDKEWGPGREAASEALESYEEGFEECQYYLESEDGEHLDRALALMRHGNELLNQAYQAALDVDERPVISWVM